MTNYVYNKLTLYGKWDDIKKIIGSNRDKQIKKSQNKSKPYKKFRFDLILPLNKNLSDKIDPINDNNTYNELLGIKLQPKNTTIIKQVNKVVLEFETPLDPPTNWIILLTELYPYIEWNLSWVDEDFHRCGNIISNPIENNRPIIINYPYDSNIAIELLFNKFSYLTNFDN